MSVENWRKFHNAMRTGDCETMRHLIATCGIDPNGCSPGSTEIGGTLHRAISDSMSLDVIKCLIDCGADINKRSYKNYTPLHYAAFKGDSTVLNLLLSCGADDTLLSSDGKTALQIRKKFTNDTKTVVF